MNKDKVDWERVRILSSFRDEIEDLSVACAEQFVIPHYVVMGSERYKKYCLANAIKEIDSDDLVVPEIRQITTVMGNLDIIVIASDILEVVGKSCFSRPERDSAPVDAHETSLIELTNGKKFDQEMVHKIQDLLTEAEKLLKQK